jgi:hypothetical protein
MGLFATLSIIDTQHDSTLYYSVCLYAEYRDFLNVTLIVVLLNVAMLSAIMHSVVILSVVVLGAGILSVVMLSVVVLRFVMLSVVAPSLGLALKH